MNDRIEQDWTAAVCELDDIVPDTDVCALVKGAQVAVFHVAGEDKSVYAIDNYDPHSQAAVLSRGIVGTVSAIISSLHRRSTSSTSICAPANISKRPSNP